VISQWLRSSFRRRGLAPMTTTFSAVRPSKCMPFGTPGALHRGATAKSSSGQSVDDRSMRPSGAANRTNAERSCLDCSRHPRFALPVAAVRSAPRSAGASVLQVGGAEPLPGRSRRWADFANDTPAKSAILPTMRERGSATLSVFAQTVVGLSSPPAWPTLSG
jgi:hypothetical protein